MGEQRRKSAMSVSSLTLGILSIITALFYYISLPTGILAIIFGSISSHRIGSKLGKAGLITGIIGISLCIFLYISMIIILTIEY